MSKPFLQTYTTFDGSSNGGTNNTSNNGSNGVQSVIDLLNRITGTTTIPNNNGGSSSNNGSDPISQIYDLLTHITDPNGNTSNPRTSGDTPSGTHIDRTGNLNSLLPYDRTSYDDMLSQLNSKTQDAFANFLAQFGITDPNELSKGQIEDWNKQLVETILNYLLEQEKRKYDYSMLQDQRAYDYQLLQDQRSYESPAAQLARLMGAGIPRNMAIQMLSSGSNASAIGASQPSAGENSGMAQGLSASESKSNELQNKLGIANAVFNGFGTVLGLVDCGVSLANAIPQVKMLANAANLSNEQFAAYKSVNAVTKAIQNLSSSSSDFASIANGWTNAQDVIDYANSNPTSDFVTSVGAENFQSAFGSTFGRKLFNDDWSNRIESKNAGDIAREFVRGQRLQNEFTELNSKKIGLEMENIQYDSLVKDAEHAEILARITQMGYQNEVLGYQSELLDAQANLAQMQAIGQNIENKNAALMYDLNESGFPMLKQKYLDELEDECKYWATIKDPDVRAARIDAWKKNEINKSKAEYLEFIHNNAIGGFAQEHPTLYNLCSIFKEFDIHPTEIAKDVTDTARNIKELFTNPAGGKR